MAFYKQPCIHCGAYIDRDARFCSACGSHSPFGYLCPTCLRPVEKSQRLCAGCGRPLYVACPVCGGQTFVQEKCEQCGGSLMVKCQNSRCGAWQFFENTKCTACGAKIKHPKSGKK
jgi:predicted amidophosphoribosyltransferase